MVGRFADISGCGRTRRSRVGEKESCPAKFDHSRYPRNAVTSAFVPPMTGSGQSAEGEAPIHHPSAERQGLRIQKSLLTLSQSLSIDSARGERVRS